MTSRAVTGVPKALVVTGPPNPGARPDGLLTPVGVSAGCVGAPIAVENEPPAVAPATGVDTFWLESVAKFWLDSVAKSLLVRVLRFWPDSGTGTVAPPVVSARSVESRAESAAVSLKSASTGRSC